ncbi:unnamed protein product [Arctogadus glacialis]
MEAEPAPARPSLPTRRAPRRALREHYASPYGTAHSGGAARQGALQDMRRKSASFFLSSEETSRGRRAGVRTAGGGSSPAGVPDGHAPRLRPAKSIDEGMFSGTTTSTTPTACRRRSACPNTRPRTQPGRPAPLRPLSYGPGAPPTTTFIHPLTGKVLDPRPPGAGLAAGARPEDDRRTRRGTANFGRQMSTVVPRILEAWE